MKRHLYNMQPLLLSAFFLLLFGTVTEGHSTATSPALATPYFAPLDDQTVDGTTLSFYPINPDQTAYTQILRSTDPSTGFEVIATLDPGTSGQWFRDYNLKPRVTYYYKLRSVKGDEVSAFSNTIALTTLSIWYEPDIVVQPTADNMAIEITVIDNSYADLYYEIFRTEYPQTSGEPIAYVQMLDSGRTETFVDYNVTPNTTYIYEIEVMVNSEGFPIYSFYSDPISIAGELQTPYFDLSQAPPSFPCGSEIALVFEDPNEGTTTEIWRSLSENDGYELIYSGGDGFYMDTEVLPHRTYYYKLRAVDGDLTSQFSEPLAQESGSDFFEPTLSATLLPDNTVQFTLQDHSYGEGSYEVYGFDFTTGLLNGFFQTVIAPDSGGTYTYIDTSVEPGHEYHYGVSAILKCDGFPVVSEFSVTITIPEEQSGFFLVDPNTDQDISALTDGTVVTNAEANIRFDAAPGAGSIVFVLNGKRSTDNVAPYAVFPENKGDFKKGHLKPGTYTLTATSYSGKNGSGSQLESATVSFTVEYTKGNKGSRVNFYPNPVVNQSTVEVSGTPGSPVRIDVYDQYGKFVSTLFRGKLNSDGAYTTNINASDFKRGSYVLSIDQKGQVETKRFSVE